MKTVLISIWFALVSVIVVWLIAAHWQKIDRLDSCERQLSRTQADIHTLAAHRMELDDRWTWIKRSLQIADGE